jgi:hypothetical protein
MGNNAAKRADNHVPDVVTSAYINPIMGNKPMFVDAVARPYQQPLEYSGNPFIRPKGKWLGRAAALGLALALATDYIYHESEPFIRWRVKHTCCTTMLGFHEECHYFQCRIHLHCQTHNYPHMVHSYLIPALQVQVPIVQVQIPALLPWYWHLRELEQPRHLLCGSMMQ